jgi:hypothetical protein
MDRKQQAKGAKPGAAPRDRRTPVRAPGSGGPPWMPLAVAGGAIAIVLLIVYLIVQSMGGEDGLSASDKAEQDASPDLPGVYVPTQGRGHLGYTFSLERTPRPFCDGVRNAGNAGETPASTPTAQSTPSPEAAATGEAASTGTPRATPTVPLDCFSSNPPSSGEHLNVQTNVDVTGNGDILSRIPPDPNVYPDNIKIPREAIPHLLEHAGVYVGYHCADGDEACLAVVQDLKDLVNDRIDNHNDRVVLANDADLPLGEIGASSWTRVLNVKYQDYDKKVLGDFIGTHSCRYDPENICR